MDTRELVPPCQARGHRRDRWHFQEPRLAPFERLAVPTALSRANGPAKWTREWAGAGFESSNVVFSFIRAAHHLAAMYTREIERPVLWAVTVHAHPA
jgi:hypothetical protein